MKKNELLNIKIINMEKEHIPQIAAIEKEVFSVPWSEKSFADALSVEHTLFYTAFADGEVVGYCGMYLAADEGEITNVAVAPLYRRQKIAERLLDKILVEAHAKGVQQIFLEVRSLNKPAMRLYQKVGFAVVGCRKNYYQYPLEDALVMKYEYADKINR